MSYTKEMMHEAGNGLYPVPGRGDDSGSDDDSCADDTAGDSVTDICLRCGGTGYRRDWRGTRVACDDCWNDNGPY